MFIRYFPRFTKRNDRSLIMALYSTTQSEKAKPKMTRQGSSQNTKTSATSRNGAKKKYRGQGR